jgi:four helix bundle protein
MIQFFNIAIGSSSELEDQLILANDLHYMGEQSFLDLLGDIGEIRWMLHAFVQRHKTDI